MFDYLIHHGIKDTWCTPNQDKQVIIKPAKLTKSTGALNYVDVMWRRLTLPLHGCKFHVYQIGELYPAILGLLSSDKTWTTFAEACTRENLIVDIYTNDGIQLPRSQVWYMFTEDMDLIIAVKNQSKFTKVDLVNNPLYIRFYSNAYFNSIEYSDQNDYVEVYGKSIVSLNDIVLFQQKMIDLTSKPGIVYGFVNGYKVNQITPFNTNIGDIVEYVYDSSIYKVIDLDIKDLLDFQSELDNKFKYLLHYSDSNRNSIDYLDDIDFWLIDKNTNNHVGIYYHKNQVDAIRILTHKDYSIPVAYLNGYLDSVDNWIDLTKLTIRMHIRKSGYTRNLVNENSRIKEFYKLPDDKLLNALVGLNSNVEVWKASKLEAAGYPELMRANTISNVTEALVEKAYGYNAISKLIGDTPKFINLYSEQQIVNLPYSHYENSTVYEYDNEGYYLGNYPHVLGSVYSTYNTNAVLVESITGLSSTNIEEFYGTNIVVLNPDMDYRMYLSGLNNGISDGKWIDVTNSDKYSIVSNALIWNIDSINEYPMVRSNKRFLGYKFKLISSDGLLKFTLTQDILINGVLSNRPMVVPMGELDIFIGKYSLIENLDYVVNFPDVVIINKTYLDDPLNKTQNVTIRFTGFCDSNLNRYVGTDTGFIDHELLSHNDKFDVRDDKVLRIIVGGALYNRSELKFSEDDFAVMVPNALNGDPYSIKDIVVPLRGAGVSDTYICRAKSLLIDKAISNYMTEWYPERKINTANVIGALYQVFSPFCCKIIYDLKNGILNDARLKNQYSDADVFDICKQYEYLLAFDPVKFDNELSNNYVIIHPHNLNTVIELDIYGYKFITRIIKLYLENKISVSHFISISTF